MSSVRVGSRKRTPSTRRGRQPIKRERTDIPGVFRNVRDDGEPIGTYSYAYRHCGRLIWETARTRSEARRRKAQTDAGKAPTSREPFATYARAWIDRYDGRTARGLSPTTREAYRDALERFAIPYFGRMKLGDFTPPDVKGLLST